MATIGVIGAGPAGLMLTIALMRHVRVPLEVRVFERGPSHDVAARADPDRSYTIDITGHGHRAIDLVDPALRDRFDAELIPFRGVQAHVIGRLMPVDEPGWTGNRGDICAALLHEIEARQTTGAVSVRFFWSHEVTLVDPVAGVVHTRHDGEAHRHVVDLMVGADGAGSMLRRALEAEGRISTRRRSIPNYSRIVRLDRGPLNRLDPSHLHLFSLRPWAVGGAILDADTVDRNRDARSAEKRFFVQMGYADDRPLAGRAAVDTVLRSVRVRLADRQRVSLRDFVSDDEVERFAERQVHHTGRTVISSTLACDRCVLLGDAGVAFPPVGQGVNAALEGAAWLGVEIGRALVPGSDPVDTLAEAARRFDERWLPDARACAAIANTVVYSSRANLACTFLLGVVTQVLRVEFVAAQVAKDARLTFQEAAAVARRRVRTLATLFMMGLGAAVLAAVT